MAGQYIDASFAFNAGNRISEMLSAISPLNRGGEGGVSQSISILYLVLLDFILIPNELDHHHRRSGLSV